MSPKNSSDGHPKNLAKSDNLFPVVGIGASAGGLEAFKALLKAIPEDSGMAYVLVQHLAPDRESQLPEILQKFTKVPVLEISDEVNVEPDHIYVMPSNKTMVANDGELLLAPRPGSKKYEDRLPIDLFFKSLAEVHQEHAIGVVLSGSASDGTLGLKAIKDSGGITIAQDPDSAAYPGMPNSAADSGAVDFILTPDKIPAKLLELTRIINSPDGQNEELPPDDKQVYSQIISLLRDQKDTDFTNYKQTTIRRRILRRMAINKYTRVADYFTCLKNNKEEQDLLYQDFLIPVTSFFRNPKCFQELKKTYLPLIYKNKRDGPIRIWVAGCSTGQEVYSLAICFKEFFDNNAGTGTEKRVQIFATDLSAPAIDKARKGIYTKLDTDSVSKTHLTTYFTKLNGGYQVKQHLRDLCVFARHDFLKDPPFRKMDLISCRNVLIFMNRYLQKKALTIFHYSLNPKGFLLLGKSETTNLVPKLFNTEARSDKIYSRNDVPNTFVRVADYRTNYSFNQNKENLTAKNKTSDFEKTADELMLSKYSPPGVVINETMDIVQFRGSTQNYLEQSSGKPSHNLMDLAKSGLAFELRSIIHKAKKDNASAIKQNIPVNIDGRLQTISIEAVPLPNTEEPYYLILFHERTLDNGKKASRSIKESEEDEKDLRIRQLEQELVEAREDMRSVTEEQEVQNEELQSANEELQSSSEELQTLNEELETSTEELQSTNEELVVINQELEDSNKQVENERNYSQSIVANLPEPLLVLDKNLRVKDANNAFYKLFKVSEEETENVLIYELGENDWEIPKLRNLLDNLIQKKTVVTDFEITHTFSGLGEMIMLMNVCKLITDDKTDYKLLMSIVNITEKVLDRRKLKQIQESHTKELGEKVQERTNELSEANEELVLMNKELEAFAYVSSHDLQEPLRKIQTFADRILEKEEQNLSDKGKTYFSIIHESAHRMKELIEDLLAFSRLTTSEKEYVTTDLNTVIEKVTADLQVTIKEKNAAIEVEENCEADVIPFQFRQLMQNLISNALKFSRAGVPPHIVIRCSIKKGSEFNSVQLPQKNKEYCHISVTDNGIGFEDKFKDKIFEVFQKLHGKETYSGTGIGLATVKKIVDNHHGIITATSELDKGTTFNIYFPCSQA